mgnify:FL=1
MKYYFWLVKRNSVWPTALTMATALLLATSGSEKAAANCSGSPCNMPTENTTAGPAVSTVATLPTLMAVKTQKIMGLVGAVTAEAAAAMKSSGGSAPSDGGVKVAGSSYAPEEPGLNGFWDKNVKRKVKSGDLDPGALPANYNVWLEGYGISSRHGQQDDFAGNRSRTSGVIAGVGKIIAPGITVGLLIDRSHTNITVNNASQTGKVDLTQFGALASFNRGAWNLSGTVVYGIGNIHTERTEAGISTASYGVRVWSGAGQLSYLYALPNNSRIIPKLTLDWTQIRTDAFSESGGDLPVTGSSITSSRIRSLLTTEIGHSWIAGRTIMDISAYGRLVNNLSQSLGSIQVTDTGGIPTVVSGVRESKIGADTGVKLTANLTKQLNFFAAYDGQFRSNFEAHTGTVGANYRF